MIARFLKILINKMIIFVSFAPPKHKYIQDSDGRYLITSISNDFLVKKIVSS